MSNGHGKYEPTEDEIAIDFRKSKFFRVIHVDGAVGAISPSSSFIHMSVFSERAPVPRRIVHAIRAGGILGPEVLEKRHVRPGSFREVEAEWLDEKIHELQQNSSTASN